MWPSAYSRRDFLLVLCCALILAPLWSRSSKTLKHGLHLEPVSNPIRQCLRAATRSTAMKRALHTHSHAAWATSQDGGNVAMTEHA